MNDPIYPAIVFFLVLGVIVGWLLRLLWDRGQVASVEQSWRARLSAIEREREQLRSQAGAPRPAAPAVEVDSDRVRNLERELADSRRTRDEREAEIGRLRERIAELEHDSDGAAEVEGEPPAPLTQPEGQPDDLKKINGIGPGIERTLHGLGVYHYRQIAAFTPDNVAWVDRHLRFKGRIAREKWIEQAKTLAGGGSQGA